jgi:uncharacterized protein (DUF1501 family)
MTISRREFTRLIAGAGALAAAGQLSRTASVAQTTSGYRAMVGVFLFGGNDGWNTVVPTDGRYSAYASGRNPSLVLPRDSLVDLGSTGMGLHPSMAPLQTAWNEGALSVVLNTGSLFQPLTKTLYQTRRDLVPLNLMSHADEQAHWQGIRVRETSLDGYMGRIADRLPASSLSPLISIAGSNLITIGRSSSPLVLPSAGALTRTGYTPGSTNTAIAARQSAIEAFAGASNQGTVSNQTGLGISSAYAQAVTANTIVSATTSVVDQYFRNPNTGAALNSEISRQLLRTARMIEARGTLGQNRQVFFVSQGGYDNHSQQTNGVGATTAGLQANLLSDLAMALAGFYAAMKALGVSNNVTAFTMSDFGRVYRGNAQNGSDHAWGSNQIVIGGGLTGSRVLGAYPNQTLGGPDDINTDGRWIPSISIEEYIGAIALWHGVSTADIGYVFPNWATWNGGGRGPIGLFS